MYSIQDSWTYHFLTSKLDNLSNFQPFIWHNFLNHTNYFPEQDEKRCNVIHAGVFMPTTQSNFHTNYTQDPTYHITKPCNILYSHLYQKDLPNFFSFFTVFPFENPPPINRHLLHNKHHPHFSWQQLKVLCLLCFSLLLLCCSLWNQAKW